ncbi:MAG: ABC transporter ATP-binding protein, partial [Myxococcota bacterium]
MTARLATQHLRHTFGQRVVLDDVSLTVEKGELLGLLGPNGAGKTTLLRVLAGVLEPEHGTVWLDGRALGPGDRALRAEAGVVFQRPSLDEHLTARENLRLGAMLYGVRGAEARSRADELLTFMELHERADELVRTYSGGMRRRLELARALIHRPSVLLLDEPTVGLDLDARRRTRRLLATLRRLQELTIIMSTHDVDEAEPCDRLAILDRGHVVACASPAELLGRVAGDVVTIDALDPEDLARDLRATLEIDAEVRNEQVVCEHPSGHALVPRIVEAFLGSRI